MDAFLTEVPESPKVDPSFIGSDPYEAADQEDIPYLPLALTFSFPVEQSALDSGVLLTWTKGFSAKNAVGKDVVKLLQDAFDRKHIHVKCVALVNDVSLYSFIPHIHIRSFYRVTNCTDEDLYMTDCRSASFSSIYIWRMHPRRYFWNRN